MATAWTERRRGRQGRRPTPLRLAILLLVAAIFVAGGLWWTAAHWSPARARYPVQGVAVSAANGDIAWPTLRARGADFAYIEATGGSAERDAAFARNWAGAREAGLRYGAVHRYSLCRLGGEQARLFIASVPRDNAALPPVVALDLDPRCPARPSRDTLLSELNIFLNEIEAHSGKPAILRIARPFEDAYHVSEGINRTVWLVADLVPPTYASHPWVMWTANHWRRVRGVEGAVAWTVVKP